MLNKVFLIGNVGGIPEVRVSNNQTPIARFSLATSESWKDSTGQKQEKTEWHRIVVFGNLAKIVENYVKKGSRLFILGSIKTRKYSDSSGTEKYTTEVIVSAPGDVLKMLDGKTSDGSSFGNTDGFGEHDGSGSIPSIPSDDKVDDDIPF